MAHGLPRSDGTPCEVDQSSDRGGLAPVISPGGVKTPAAVTPKSPPPRPGGGGPKKPFEGWMMTDPADVCPGSQKLLDSTPRVPKIWPKAISMEMGAPD